MKPDILTVAEQNDPQADKIIRRWEELKSDRAPREAGWEDVARLIRPQRGGFTSGDPTKRRQDQPLSSAPITAHSNFAASLYGTLINPANRWMDFRTIDEDLNKWQPMKEWLYTSTTLTLASFRPSISTFYKGAIQLLGDTTAFGTSPQYEEMDLKEKKILDVTLSLSEVVIDVDAFGQVIEVVRKYELRAGQAAGLFGLDNLPEPLRNRADKGSSDKSVFYTRIIKNEDWQRGKLGPRGKRWSSVSCSEIGRKIVRDRGYDQMPFSVARYETLSGETYGYAPGILALASSRVNNLMEAANLRAGQKAADPTLLAPDKEAWQLNGLVKPGHTLYGGVDYQGRQMVRMLDNFSSTGLSLEMQQRKVEEIREVFHWSLTNLVGRTGVGAIEALEMQEQRLRLQAPHIGAIQSEYLAPKIARRFQMLWKAGQIPPPPEGVPAVAMDVHYTSVAAQAQKSAEGVAVVRVLGDLQLLAQIDPQKAARISARLDDDAIMDHLQEARGGPADIYRSRDEADKIMAQNAQAAQQQQMMAQAKEGAGIAKDLAGAGILPGMQQQQGPSQ